MNFLNLAKKRKSTFDFSDKKVSSKLITLFLESARWAPSCTNAQPWHFIVIKDPKRVDQAMRTVNYGFFHTNPPVLIAVVLRADLCRGKGFVCFRGKDSGVHDSYMSCGIAAAHMALAAADKGVNSCILTPDQKKIKQMLKISRANVVPLLVAIGYEPKAAVKVKRERRPLKSMVSYDKESRRGR